MPSIAIKITNLPQIRAAFAKAPSLMARNLNLAIRKTVIAIEGDSRRNTPVLTGRLRASTYTQYGNLRGEVGTRTVYDIFVHEGTRYMRARPYLRMAVQANSGRVDGFFTEAVDKTLHEIGRQT